MFNYEANTDFTYKYKHQHLANVVMISERLNLAMTGGLDKKVVVHDLQTGKTLKTFDMKHGNVTSLFRFGSVVAVGDYHSIRFFDLKSQKMMDFKMKITGKLINCVNVGIKDSEEGCAKEGVLVVGGGRYGKIDEIRLSQELNGSSRSFSNQKCRASIFGFWKERLKDYGNKIRSW